MKRTILIAAALLMCGCSDLPDTATSGAGLRPVPMRYVGPATLPGDVINGCRVYAFQLNGYTQTAVMCSSAFVATGSGHHQSSDDASTAATQ